MSNEFDDQTNGYNNNQCQNNTDNSANQDDQSRGNSYYGENAYSYRSSDIIQDGNQTNQSYTVYPMPNLVKKNKQKKKGGFKGALKLTAAALAFGLIAGAAFQGYYMIAWPEDAKLGQDSDAGDNLQAAEVTKDTDKDTIPASSGTSDTVVTDVSDVVANVMPSIVAINSTATITIPDFFGREYQQESQGSGSGIIIGQNGTNLLIVTNNHVIEDATAIEIVFSDETTASAAIKGADSQADLAVLSVDMSKLSEKTAAAIKVATLGSSDDMVPGEMVIAIGNALGYGQSVTVGYISAVNREVTIENQTMTLLQTDAAINPGNSGGALINTKGEVVGINSVKFASEEVEGMGYAIPISDAIPMINELMNREVITEDEQGFLGIDTSTAQEVTQAYSERFNMPIGVYVNDVVEASPAEKAGLMQGDIITGLDGSEIETIDELKNILSYKKAGQKIELTIQVMDGGVYVEKVLQVTLGKRE